MPFSGFPSRSLTAYSLLRNHLKHKGHTAMFLLFPFLVSSHLTCLVLATPTCLLPALPRHTMGEAEKAVGAVLRVGCDASCVSALRSAYLHWLCSQQGSAGIRKAPLGKPGGLKQLAGGKAPAQHPAAQHKGRHHQVCWPRRPAFSWIRTSWVPLIAMQGLPRELL